MFERIQKRLAPRSVGQKWHQDLQSVLDMQEGPWAIHKLNRQRRIRDIYEYVTDNVPELLDKTLPTGLVIDFGPGLGELLEIARMLRYDVLGVDAESVSAGGMGNAYTRVCELWHRRQKLPVEYCGFRQWVLESSLTTRSMASLINMRGSIEQCCAEYMDGPPHDLHHNCKKLNWKCTQETQEYFNAIMLNLSRCLLPDGVILIHANGTGNTDGWYGDAICKSANHVGLETLTAKQLVHKFRRPRVVDTD